jgi:hypothetical protein
MKSVYLALAIAAAFALFMLFGVAVVEISANGFPTHFK